MTSSKAGQVRGSIDWLRTADRIARRTERERRRQDAYRQRIHASAEAVRRRLPPGPIADLKSLKSWAEIWMVNPISGGWRWHNDRGGWFSGYGPDLGRPPRLSLEIRPRAEQLTCCFSHESINWHGYVVSPLDCRISAIATLISMSVKSLSAAPLAPMLLAFAPVVEDAVGLRRPPEAGVQILAGDELFCPFDLRLQDQRERPYRDPVEDGGVPAGMLTLMIAFDPFVADLDQFSVIFLPGSGETVAPSELVAIRCTGPYITAVTKGLDEFPRIVHATNDPGK